MEEEDTQNNFKNQQVKMLSKNKGSSNKTDIESALPKHATFILILIDIVYCVLQ